MSEEKVARLSQRAQTLLEDFDEAAQDLGADFEEGFPGDARDRAIARHGETKAALRGYISKIERWAIV